MSATECLQQSSLFSDLTPEQVEQIAALGQKIRYDANEVIIRVGEAAHEVYVVCRGIVEVDVSQGAISDALGLPQPVYLMRMGQGSMFGEMALVDRKIRSATVRCVQDGTVIYAIPLQALSNLCAEDHDIGYVLMHNVAHALSSRLRLRNPRS